MGCVTSCWGPGWCPVSVEVAKIPRVIPAAQICPSLGSSWKEFSSAGKCLWWLPPSAAQGPVTSSTWWLRLGFVHSLCFFPHPQGRRGIADPSGAAQSARESGIMDEGCLGLLQGWLQARHQHPALRAVGAVLLSSTLLYFIFSNKGWKITKLSPFDGMKP